MKNQLRERFHCTCDFSPYWWWFTVRASLTFFLITTLAYLTLWLTDTPMATLTLSSVWPRWCGEFQGKLSSGRLLDPFFSALVFAGMFQATGVSVLYAFWEVDYEKWQRTSFSGFLEWFGEALLHVLVGCWLIAFMLMHGTLCALVFAVPIAVSVYILVLCLCLLSGLVYAAYESVRSSRRLQQSAR